MFIALTHLDAVLHTFEQEGHVVRYLDGHAEREVAIHDDHAGWVQALGGEVELADVAGRHDNGRHLAVKPDVSEGQHLFNT